MIKQYYDFYIDLADIYYLLHMKGSKEYQLTRVFLFYLFLTKVIFQIILCSLRNSKIRWLTQEILI